MPLGTKHPGRLCQTWDQHWPQQHSHSDPHLFTLVRALPPIETRTPPIESRTPPFDSRTVAFQFASSPLEIAGGLKVWLSSTRCLHCTIAQVAVHINYTLAQASLGRIAVLFNLLCLGHLNFGDAYLAFFEFIAII